MFRIVRILLSSRMNGVACLAVDGVYRTLTIFHPAAADGSDGELQIDRRIAKREFRSRTCYKKAQPTLRWVGPKSSSLVR